jgi:aminopeptidase-like protein
MIGEEIHDFARSLWHFNRSITGDGVRLTLGSIKAHLPQLQIRAVPTGVDVFDWKIPKEWKVAKAYIITPSGRKICDFQQNNLHLVGYSTPVHAEMTLEELRTHLHTLPDQPNAIPYITSYYEERWGFCISYTDYLSMEEGTYTVVIDSELIDGELNYGELLIKGKTEKEILLSSYVCHPSMANNELSGPTVLTFIAKWLKTESELEFSYRIVFVPETIGSIAFLSANYETLQKHVVAGFNLSCLGDDRTYSYLPTRFGNTVSDEVAKHVLRWIYPDYCAYTWFDRGSDERQYCAPGIDLPIATIMRSKYGEYPEYHTSLDDLEHVVTAAGLNGGYWAIRTAVEVIEKNKIYYTTCLGEPQLGKRNLYPTLSTKNTDYNVKLMMDMLSMLDGDHSLLDVANLINVPIWDLYGMIDTLKQHGLIGTLTET